MVGEAGDVDEAVARIPAAQPDVVLLDVHLPGGGGQQVAGPAAARRTPSSASSPCRCRTRPTTSSRVIRAGARGYVTKSISGDELADAVDRVAAGDAVFSPRLAGFVLDAFAGAARPRPIPSSTSSPRGSGTCCVSSPGATPTRRSRRELVLSVKTIETHVSAVLRKLQLSNRHELGRWATDRRLL